MKKLLQISFYLFLLMHLSESATAATKYTPPASLRRQIQDAKNIARSLQSWDKQGSWNSIQKDIQTLDMLETDESIRTENNFSNRLSEKKQLQRYWYLIRRSLKTWDSVDSWRSIEDIFYSNENQDTNIPIIDLTNPSNKKPTNSPPTISGSEKVSDSFYRKHWNDRSLRIFLTREEKRVFVRIPLSDENDSKLFYPIQFKESPFLMKTTPNCSTRYNL